MERREPRRPGLVGWPGTQCWMARRGRAGPRFFPENSGVCHSLHGCRPTHRPWLRQAANSCPPVPDPAGHPVGDRAVCGPSTPWPARARGRPRRRTPRSQVAYIRDHAKIYQQRWTSPSDYGEVTTIGNQDRSPCRSALATRSAPGTALHTAAALHIDKVLPHGKRHRKTTRARSTPGPRAGRSPAARVVSPPKRD
ncbi:RNA 2',3'-cyclic phosphodiesterase [Glutamicibacter creatinolyticus]|uniref:RNA 2',3'-cyclic phosphodiesterase n=1 Tax=Glutamicibacter creatinolyticus TaxID=162496 RepID=A0A5B7WU30_9MICC|nr:RNA 2',3'-cyclic phosphodiesterase [Glutamicibacter creatinolyticus]